MVKRYYKSCITLRYSIPMTLSAILVFIFAFFTFQTGNKIIYTCGIISSIALILILLLVQYKKYKISSQLKGILKIDSYYNEGAMIGKSFFLEDKALLCDTKLKIKEYKTTGFTTMSVKAFPKDQQEITLERNEEKIVIMADNLLQAQRLAAFLQHKNPGMILNHVETDGTGTLKELGAI